MAELPVRHRVRLVGVLAGLACLGCCALPALAGAGLLAAGVAAWLGTWLPALALVLLAATAALAWKRPPTCHDTDHAETARACAGRTCNCS